MLNAHKFAPQSTGLFDFDQTGVSDWCGDDLDNDLLSVCGSLSSIMFMEEEGERDGQMEIHG